MTVFQKLTMQQVRMGEEKSGRSAIACDCGGPFSKYLPFTIGGYQPRITSGFTPPADNPHSHNVVGKPGYDERCRPADPVPARFSVICPKCGRGWYYEAEEVDLRVNPEQIIAGLSRRLNEALRAAIPNPAMRLAVGNQIEIHAQRVLRESRIAAVLGEIPARGATRAQEEFCAQFMHESSHDG